MPEWLMGADCKSAGFAYAGSNPARPNEKILRTRTEMKNFGIDRTKNITFLF